MIKLGVIGMSEGNGHPYSWSAIINGDFDNAAMDQCGFPAIPLYLRANRDTLGIDGALVTHIWTQDRKLSEHIALAAGIETVVDRADAMIGQVDAVLLARDDPEHHVAMAKPFLESGVPVFIDKPLAIRLDDLSYFKRQNEQGKWFMSCSSMRYSSECRTVKTELTSLGRIELVTVIGIKDWTRYGIHMLEALYALLEDPMAVSVRHVSQAGRDIVLITFETGLLATVHIFKDVAPTFQLSLFGRNGWRLVEIRDSYWMFRETLNEFIRSVREGRPRLKFETTENLIRTLVGAKESLERGGETVHLK
jgi:predicted dehydrogenase